jgi:signal transduction histidine kinase
LAQVLQAFAPQAQEKGVRLDPPGGASTQLMVQASEDGLTRVLTNLIGNAVKYTPSGGRVSVTVRRDGSLAEVAVSDSGIGISPEDLPKLGTEFFRAESAKRAEIPGTGLGLSIVREQLRRFGGSLEIKSTPGAGSTFSAKLPLTS